MEKLSIILPVFNEAEIIRKFSDELYEVLGSVSEHYSFEVIFCVDKSSDGTESIIRNICDERRDAISLNFSRRFGHQMCLVAGMDKCTGNLAIMMDCDLEHPPSLIPTLLEKYEEGFDVVHTKREYNEKIGWLKRKSSGAFYKVISFLSSLTLEEGNADFRLVSRRCIDVFKNSVREQHQFLRGLFRWIGFEQCTVSFVSGQRGGGTSKYSLSRLISFAINGIVSFSKVPLTLFSTVGFVVALFGFIFGAYSVIASLFQENVPLGWPSVIALVAFIGGLQLMALGILGRYIGEIFDEVKGRPLYIVEDEYCGR